jgi:CxxC-x17-CxxC domain-containing protein
VVKTPTHTRRPQFSRPAAVEATVVSNGHHERPVERHARPHDVRPAAKPVSANGAPASRHKIECSECGLPAEVRFNPDPTRPVYCDSCYSKRSRRGRRPAEATAQV